MISTGTFDILGLSLGLSLVRLISGILRHHTRCVTLNIVPDIVPDIVHDIIPDIIPYIAARIFFCMQDCVCLVAPFPFRTDSLEEVSVTRDLMFLVEEKFGMLDDNSSSGAPSVPQVQ
jgi:hypothetical protein